MLSDTSPNTRDAVQHLLTKGRIIEERVVEEINARVEQGATGEGAGNVDKY
jgi:hypothetical protein